MSEEQETKTGEPKKGAATIGGTTGGVVAAVFMLLVQFGYIGPAREAEKKEIENRLTQLESWKQSNEGIVSSKIDNLAQLMELRFRTMEQQIAELKADVRRNP